MLGVGHTISISYHNKNANPVALIVHCKLYIVRVHCTMKLQFSRFPIQCEHTYEYNAMDPY